ncbi:MAG: hypothetical protein C0605_04210 [Hyphomicrobiales bacterium]|nr:MAG: hypothetical protein C0605_04210 [Hyphomicrobiales bacterium]
MRPAFPPATLGSTLPGWPGGAAGQYRYLHKECEHDFVRQSRKEYARGTIRTNIIAGYFSILKRRVKGVYPHCGKQHLQCYLAEFDFRYNNREKMRCDNFMRAETTISGAVGKRLMYRDLSLV